MSEKQRFNYKRADEMYDEVEEATGGAWAFSVEKTEEERKKQREMVSAYITKEKALLNKKMKKS